jgi:two-component system invasion response regulator UvrY
MTRSILIADDHEVVRSGLAILVKSMLPHINILQAESVEEASDLLNEHPVELLLCDINMPGGNSFDMLHRLKAIQPGLKILVLTAYQMKFYEKRYLQEGANGYLNKTSNNEEIRKAISSVLQNGYYQSDKEEADLHSPARETLTNVTDLLSYREMEVAQRLAKGLGILEISNMLNLRSNTVSTYKKRIFMKLDVTSVPELVSLLGSYTDWQID